MDMEITKEDREEQVAQLFDALHNSAAAKSVRISGLCGTVHHAAANFLDAYRIASKQAVLAKLRDLPLGPELEAVARRTGQPALTITTIAAALADALEQKP